MAHFGGASTFYPKANFNQIDIHLKTNSQRPWKSAENCPQRGTPERLNQAPTFRCFYLLLVSGRVSLKPPATTKIGSLPNGGDHHKSLKPLLQKMRISDTAISSMNPWFGSNSYSRSKDFSQKTYPFLWMVSGNEVSPKQNQNQLAFLKAWKMNGPKMEVDGSGWFLRFKQLSPFVGALPRIWDPPATHTLFNNFPYKRGLLIWVGPGVCVPTSLDCNVTGAGRQSGEGKLHLPRRCRDGWFASHGGDFSPQTP